MSKQGTVKVVNVSFLGGFVMVINGNTLTDELNRSQKLWNVLSYLVVNRRRQIPQSEFIELFWSSESGANPANALKTLLHRIRAMLEPYFGSEIAPIVSQRGSYSWNPAIHCEVDVDRFEQLCVGAGKTESDIEKRIELYRQAIELYRGDFLPKLANQLWVLPLSARYHTMYLNAIKSLSALLEQTECYAEISDLCIRASEVDPLDEDLYILIIRALLRQGKDGAALGHYEKATDLLYKNLGIRPSEDLRSLHAEIMKQEQSFETDLEIIQRDLKESSFKVGAFFCDYGVFRETYRLEARRCARNGTCVHIVLFTVSLPNGGVPPLNVLSGTMAQLQEVLVASLRQGDVVSKFSGAQFVVLLPAANFEDSIMVAERVVSEFYRQHRRHYLKITYRTRELELA